MNVESLLHSFLYYVMHKIILHFPWNWKKYSVDDTLME